MEMASVLSNEPWSDRPACTDPLLAQLARLVNDHTNDERRDLLAVLIPDVVGVHGDGLAWEVSLTVAVAAEAILDVPEEQQRALAAGLLRCEQLAGPDERPLIRAALDRAPGAEAWARGFAAGTGPLSTKHFHRRTAPTVLRCAVQGIVTSTVPDPDARLRDLLVAGIRVARRTTAPAAPTRPSPSVGLPPARDRRGSDDRQGRLQEESRHLPGAAGTVPPR
jgi:hypothetical protein